MKLEPRILSQADTFRSLGRQVVEDAIEAGWLRPCAVKEGARGPAKKLYSVADLRRVEDRILAGEYPGAKTEK